MANTDHANGLTPVAHASGGTPGRMNAYEIASATAEAIHTGDLVKSTGEAREIVKAAPGDTAIGVFAGCEYARVDGEPAFARYWPAATVTHGGAPAKAWVYDDPNIIFEVQASGPLARGDIRAVADIVANGPDASLGTSGAALDSTTIAATGTAQLKILGLVDRSDNDYGDYARVAVLIMQHELRGGLVAV